jgi:hypothetical protein
MRPDDGKLTAPGPDAVGADSLGDLDGDGLRELLVTTYGTTAADTFDLVFFAGRTDWPATVDWKDGDFVIATGRTTLGGSVGLLTGDLNGDGRQDLVLPNALTDIGKLDLGGCHRRVARRQCRGPRRTAPPMSMCGSKGTRCTRELGTWMVVMDLDGDDYDDIVAPAAYEPGTVAIVGTTYIFFGQP